MIDNHNVTMYEHVKKRIKKNGAGLSDVSVNVSDDVGDAVSDEDEEEERNDFDMIE